MEKICRQFKLQTWTSFIGQSVHSAGREGGGDGVKWIDEGPVASITLVEYMKI